MNKSERDMVRPVRPKDFVSFHCRRCAACCRHITNQIMLESLDAFRLAHFLKARGDGIDSMDDVFAQYAEPILLAEGYPVFVLQAVGPDNSCFF